MPFTALSFGTNRLRITVNGNGAGGYIDSVELLYHKFGPTESGAAPVETRHTLDAWNPAKSSPIGLENVDVWADHSVVDSISSLTTRYLRGDRVDELLGRVDIGGSTETQYWYLTDHLGSIRTIVTATGTVASKIDYNAFGQITAETNPAIRGNYAFTSRVLDKLTGLQNNRIRDYDPDLGRFLTKDPIGFTAGDPNIYRYVHNMPTGATDPSGLIDHEFPIDLGDGFRARFDRMQRPGGVVGGHLHVVNRRGEAVAQVGLNGGFRMAHGGVPFNMPAGQIPGPVRRAINRTLKGFRRALGPIGCVVGVFVIAQNVEAHGPVGAGVREVPFLGDFVGIDDTMREESAIFRNSLNRHVRQGHERAFATLLPLVEHELNTRRAANPDLVAVRQAIRALYEELQSRYYLEAATGRVANINEPVREFQVALDRATQAVQPDERGDVGGGDW